MSAQRIRQQQLPLCTVCQLSPAPQSIQHLPFIILEVFLMFYSIKIALIVLLFGYSFAKIGWYCPQCKRQVIVKQQAGDNLIIRLSNCLFVISLQKFRIISTILSIVLFYLLYEEYALQPKIIVQKTWYNIAYNSGYESYLDNSYRAGIYYQEYPLLGQWELDGYVIKEIQQKNTTRVYVKMSPTQFKNPQTQDLVVILTNNSLFEGKQLQKFSHIKFKGQWEGRHTQAHVFRFFATSLINLGQKMELSQIKLFDFSERFIKLLQHQSKNKQTNKQVNLKKNL